MGLPPEIRVQESPGEVVVRLPHRRPLRKERPRGAAPGCAAALLGFGGLMLCGIGSQLGDIASERGATGVLILLFYVLPFAAFMGLAPVLLGIWILAGGRSEFRMTRTTFRMRERLGPFFYFRSIPTEWIRAFRVSPRDGECGELRVELSAGAPRHWARGYPASLLDALAAELNRRLGARPAELGGVERLPEGVRVTLPERGWRRAGPVAPVLLFLLGLVAALSLAVLQEYLRNGTGWKEGAAAAAGFGGLLAIFGAALYRNVRRVTTFEYTGNHLRVVERDPLRTRVRDWPRSDIRAIEIRFKWSGGRDGSSWGRHQLVVRLSDGRIPVLLDWRDEVELAWVAGVLRRGRNQPPAATEAAAAPGAVCQVCGTALAEAVIACVRCATPHHQECWDYAGRCSTYGCGETRRGPFPARGAGDPGRPKERI